jgi:hypothetical protein
MKSFLFKPEMITAILEGRKSQTRRVATDLVVDDDNGHVFYRNIAIDIHTWINNILDFAPYKIGEVVYAKETWGFNPDYPNIYSHVCYKLNKEHEHDEIKWKSPMFMPEKAARIYLRIIDVSVERLDAIGNENAIEEGIEIVKSNGKSYFKDYSTMVSAVSSAIYSFRTLWEKINGLGSWDKNPYVFAYEFEQVEKCYKDNSFCTCKGLCRNAC